jgi:hypothetical protein
MKVFLESVDNRRCVTRKVGRGEFWGVNVGKTHCSCFALLWYAGVEKSGKNQDSAW